MNTQAFINNLLKSTFASTMDDLAHKYTFLSELSDEKREKYVEDAKNALKALDQEKNSSETQTAKKILLRFKYAHVFAFRIDGFEKWPSRYMESFFLDFEHVYNRSKSSRRMSLDEAPFYEKLQNFKYSPPLESEFMELVESILSKTDFSTQADFLTRDTSLRFPCSQNQSLNEWAKNILIEESCWKHEYEHRIFKWNSQWFKSKSDLNKIHEDWRKRRAEVEKFLLYVNDFFYSLYWAKSKMEDLANNSRSLSISVRNLDKANTALREGTKLKHFLLEEGADRMQIMKILNNALS